MNNQTPRCCQNISSFLITYDIGSKFLVCDSCIKLSCWSRGIQEKKLVSEIDGQGRPDSISEPELVTYE